MGRTKQSYRLIKKEKKETPALRSGIKKNSSSTSSKTGKLALKSREETLLEQLQKERQEKERLLQLLNKKGIDSKKRSKVTKNVSNDGSDNEEDDEELDEELDDDNDNNANLKSKDISPKQIIHEQDVVENVQESKIEVMDTSKHEEDKNLSSKDTTTENEAVICEVDLGGMKIETENNISKGIEIFIEPQEIKKKNDTSKGIEIFIDPQDTNNVKKEPIDIEIFGDAVKSVGKKDPFANISGIEELQESQKSMNNSKLKIFKSNTACIEFFDVFTDNHIKFLVRTVLNKDEEKKIITCQADGGREISDSTYIERFQSDTLKNPSVVFLLDYRNEDNEKPIIPHKEDILFTDEKANYKIQPVSINVKACLEPSETIDNCRDIFCSGMISVMNLHCGYCGVVLPNGFEVDLRLEPTCVCSNCHRSFSNDLNLRYHRKSYQKRINCEVKGCDFSCRSKDLLVKHSKSQHAVMSCSYCEKTFTEYHKLRNHEYKHKTENQMKECKYCHKDFRVSELYKHIERAHTKSGSIKCPHEGCNLVIKQTYLSIHLKKIHSDESDRICTTCGKKIKLSYYADHEKIHQRETEKIKCNYCDMMFLNEDSREKHENYRHPYIDRQVLDDKAEMADDLQDSDICIRCFIVDCTFTTLIPKEMRSHYSETHCLNDRSLMKFRCPQDGCSFMGKKKFHINVHYKRAHSNAMVYACPVCGKRLASNASRVRHVRVHTGEQPFSCAVCDRKFNQKTPRNSHEKKLHNYFRTPGRTIARPTTKQPQLAEVTEYDEQEVYMTPIGTEIVIA